jgi:hypothetical protein
MMRYFDQHGSKSSAATARAASRGSHSHSSTTSEPNTPAIQPLSRHLSDGIHKADDAAIVLLLRFEALPQGRPPFSVVWHLQAGFGYGLEHELRLI